ncbi:hypothetical protein HPY42_01945 [Coprothermobacteraceae bacterium]|nr:hypothetical protein [Coprothermobacteraceae bacterium]
MTNWQVFFIAFPLWVFAVGTVVMLALILSVMTKYGRELQKSLEDIQKDIKTMTLSAAQEVPSMLKNVNETTAHIKDMTQNLSQLTAVLPLVIRPSLGSLAIKAVPSIMGLVNSLRKRKGK